jgi:hypothetical protein
MPVKLLTPAKLKKALLACSEEELVEILTELSSKFKPVGEFLTLRFGGAELESDVLDKYKKIIRNEYFPARGDGRARTKVARDAIRDFCKICTDRANYIDIMLYFVENCMEYTDYWGDIDSAFYNSAESVFYDAVKEVGNHSGEVYRRFEDRFLTIITTANEAYGFRDAMQEIFSQIEINDDIEW